MNINIIKASKIVETIFYTKSFQRSRTILLKNIGWNLKNIFDVDEKI